MGEFPAKMISVYELPTPETVDDHILSSIRSQAKKNAFFRRVKMVAMPVVCSFGLCIFLLHAFFGWKTAQFESGQLEEDSQIYLEIIGFSSGSSFYSFSNEDFSGEPMVNLL